MLQSSTLAISLYYTPNFKVKKIRNKSTAIYLRILFKVEINDPQIHSDSKWEYLLGFHL